MQVPKLERCQALCNDGKPCNAQPIRGEAFCAAHLKMGYALFTVGALAKSSSINRPGGRIEDYLKTRRGT